MSKRPVFTKSVETWLVSAKGKQTTIVKVAVRDQAGRFHGATNFREKSK